MIKHSFGTLGLSVCSPDVRRPVAQQARIDDGL